MTAHRPGKASLSRKQERKNINKKLRLIPKWARVFDMYDIRIALAERDGDKKEVNRLIHLKETFATLIRRDYERRNQ